MSEILLANRSIEFYVLHGVDELEIVIMTYMLKSIKETPKKKGP